MEILYTVPTVCLSRTGESPVGLSGGTKARGEGFAPLCELINPSYNKRVEIGKGKTKLIFKNPDGSAAKVLGVKLGKLMLKAEGGIASSDPDALPDGVIRPILLTEDGEISCEPFKKAAGAISALPTEELVLRNMLCRLKEAEKRIVTLEKEIERLTELVGREIVLKL